MGGGSPDLQLINWAAIDQGDGDGFLEAGETVAIWFGVDNAAGATAINARADMTTTEPLATIIDATAHPIIDPDHGGNYYDRYEYAEFTIDPGCTTGGFFDFEVTIEADNFGPTTPSVFQVGVDCLGPDSDGDGVPDTNDICPGFDDGLEPRCFGPVVWAPNPGHLQSPLLTMLHAQSLPCCF